MQVQRLSVCRPIDKLLKGGIEHGIITNVYGPAGSGKTNLALVTTVSCIRNGKRVIFIDTENGFSPERFAQLAEPELAKQIILIKPNDFDDQNKSIKKVKIFIKNSDIGLVILDSLVTLYRLELDQENYQEINRQLARQLGTLSWLAREYDLPVLITNQVYSDFATGGVELTGRDIPRYISKCLIELRKLNNGKREAIIRKHRSLPEGRRIHFQITNSGLEEVKGFKIF